MGLLIIIVILGLGYFFLMMPARRRRSEHAAMQNSVDIGDEVITAGGLHGYVKEIDDEDGTVQLEIAPGTVVKHDRRAIAAVARDVEVEVEPPETPAETGEQAS